ncbi:hypothetical protein D3C75_1119390 [compost metagenome]
MTDPQGYFSQRHGNDRQDHVLQPVRQTEIRIDGFQPAGGQPAQLDGEEHHQEQGQPEAGHRNSCEGKPGDNLIQP